VKPPASADIFCCDLTVKEYQKISDTEGGFTGALDDGDHFAHSVSQIGDLDGDGIMDLAVGAELDDDGGTDRGALYILFLNSDGTVKSFQKISDTEGGFEGILDDGDFFGHRVVRLDDHNGDGVVDLLIGALLDDDGGKNRGAAYILFLKKTENEDHVGIFKPNRNGNGLFILRNGFSGSADHKFVWHSGTAIPLVGDWDGDGTDGVGVFKSNANGNGVFILRNGFSGPPDFVFPWNLATNTPLVGDWDGDGTDGVGIHKSNANGDGVFIFWLLVE